MTSSTHHHAATEADYQLTMRVAAPPAAAFDALTTPAGLAAWWVPVTGSGLAGGELRFSMNAPEPLVIQVEQAVRPAVVRWAVTACDFEPDWVGTRPAFTITPAGDGCQVSFRHHGLTAQLECIEMCTKGWNHYLGTSLRAYLETGAGSPLGSPADQARRAR